MTDTTVAHTGLYFAESPIQGPDGRLYVSDFYAHEVRRIDPQSWEADFIRQIAQRHHFTNNFRMR